MVTRRWWLLVPFLTSGCLEVGGFQWRIDVPAHTAQLTLTGLTSSSTSEAAGDLRSLVEDFVAGENLQKRYPRARFGERTLRVNGDELVLDVVVDWTFPTDLGLRDWDAGHAFRFCPEAGYDVLRANADYRDPDGCVIWNTERTALHLDSDDGAHDRTSLVPVFQAWEAAGRPPLDAFVSSWVAEHP
jgi:hypothetical protein